MSGFASLAAMLGDIPPDSVTGTKLKGFIAALMMDAKSGGIVGSAFKEVVEAGRNSGDSIYRNLPPEEAMTVQATLNGLKGALQ